MNPRDDLHQELIAALEKVTGPDRDLDGRILMAVNSRVCATYRGLPDYATEIVQREGLQAPTARTIDIPAYTASIDAAMTLVPEDWYVKMTTRRPSSTAGKAATAGCYTGMMPTIFVDAATPAIALCIAALKARTTSKEK